MSSHPSPHVLHLRKKPVNAAVIANVKDKWLHRYFKHQKYYSWNKPETFSSLWEILFGLYFHENELEMILDDAFSGLSQLKT